jgi:hypothetical protein
VVKVANFYWHRNIKVTPNRKVQLFIVLEKSMGFIFNCKAGFLSLASIRILTKCDFQFPCLTDNSFHCHKMWLPFGFNKQWQRYLQGTVGDPVQLNHCIHGTPNVASGRRLI